MSEPGHVQVDWPRAAAFFGGLAAAVTIGVIEWSLGVALAAFPLFRMLNRRRLPGARGWQSGSLKIWRGR